MVAVSGSTSDAMAEQAEPGSTKATPGCHRLKILGRVCVMSKVNVTVQRYSIAFHGVMASVTAVKGAGGERNDVLRRS